MNTEVKKNIRFKVAHCRLDRDQNECWFMANIKGDIRSGISQSEEDFDYDNFIPTSPLNIEEGTESSSESFFEELDDLDLDFTESGLMDSVGFNDDTLQRSSRYKFYSQGARTYQYDRITKIQTICPNKKKKLYESIGLSCNDLRKSKKRIQIFLESIYFIFIFSSSICSVS